jgi:hypothetical protein
MLGKPCAYWWVFSGAVFILTVLCGLRVAYRCAIGCIFLLTCADLGLVCVFVKCLVNNFASLLLCGCLDPAL